jgi:YbbR domain-containing protein
MQMKSSPPDQPKAGRRIRWLILSLLVGAATLAVMIKTDKQELEIAIPPSFVNLSDQLLLMEPHRQSVNLLISGTAATLETFDGSAVACRLDLATLTAGVHRVPVTPSDVMLPKGVALKELLTTALTIRLETMFTKTVDIVAVLEGSPATGHAVAAVHLKPDRITLKATQALLADIDTVATKPIRLENAAESFKKEVPLDLPETIAVEPPLRIVVAEVEIDPRIVTRVLASIPVAGRGASTGYTINPAAISLTVSGPESVVSAMESDPAFSVAVDLKGLLPGSHTRKAVISLPLQAKLVKADPEDFSVTIEK